VIDSGLLVRALLRPTPSAALTVVQLALEGTRVIGMISPALLQEVFTLLCRTDLRRLTHPPLDDDLIDRFVRYVAQRFHLVPGVLGHVSGVPGLAAENPAVVGAVEGRAEAIITDDPSLLRLGSITVSDARVQIWEAGAFVRRGLR
jgi:predicted nucleic acid-binding protein